MNPNRESLMRSLETGLPIQYEQTASGGRRIYQRLIDRCEQCHSCCTGTMFRPTICAQTGKEISPHLPPPASCPLPLHL